MTEKITLEHQKIGEEPVLVEIDLVDQVETWTKTWDLRWVDKSTVPQLGARMVLQQLWVSLTTGKKEWRDVEVAGHISELVD